MDFNDEGYRLYFQLLLTTAFLISFALIGMAFTD